MKHPRTSKLDPWWAEVAHLRTSPETGRHETVGRRSERARDHATGTHRTLRRTPGPAAPQQPAAAPAPRPATPSRPRATLVDVAPAHSLVGRAPKTRRQSGERPTVTITGRPDGALPPQPTGMQLERSRGNRHRLPAGLASPDRLILWAVALGVLMIVASLATGS